MNATTIDAAALRKIGRTPEARVRWALRFRELDLGRLSGGDRERIWAALLVWQGRPPGPGVYAAENDGLLEAQQAVRGFIEAIANGDPDMTWTPEMAWVLQPPPRRRPGARSGLITRISKEQTGSRLVPALIVFALIDDLNAVGADRLKRCALTTTQDDPASTTPEHRCPECAARGGEHDRGCRWRTEKTTEQTRSANARRRCCNVTFLAARRQRYCTPRHAAAAAWQAYEWKRKDRRKG